MNSQNPEFKVLYNFSSAEIALIEIKRIDLPADSPVSSIYSWLVIKDGKVTKLTFKSMNKKEKEYRSFEEGELEFDDLAIFTFQGRKFELMKTDTLSDKTIALIRSFLSA